MKRAPTQQYASRDARQPSPAETPIAGDVTTFVLLVCAVLAAVAFAHWPVLDAKAVNLDDKSYLFENPVLQNPSWRSVVTVFAEVTDSSTVEGYYEPLTLVSLMLDVAAGGRDDNLRPFHVTSLTLHLFNTALIIVLLLQLSGRPWIAAGVGLVFGVHPLTVEPVAWVWERKTVLAAFFALWCLILYVRHTRRPSRTVYLGAVIMFVLALLAKPTVTPMPALLLLLDFWPLRRLSGRVVLEKLPFFAIAGVSAAVTILSTARTAVLTLPGEYPLFALPLKICYLIVFYLCKILWPTNLSSIYVLPKPMALTNPLILAAVAGTCLLILMLGVSLRWTRAPVVGVLFFIVGISPTLGVVQYSWVAASDKYVYVPAVGFLVCMAWLLSQIAGEPAPDRPARQPAAVGAAILAIAGLLIIGTRQYLEQWQTREQHEAYMLRLAPNSPYTNFGWANVLTANGDHEQAIRYFTRAIDRAPHFMHAYYNRGNTYSDLHDYPKAIEDYTRAITLKPGYAKSFNNRGIAYCSLKDFNRAIADFDKAIELAPRYADAFNNRGNARKETGDFPAAIRDYTKAIELDPNHAEAHNNRGLARVRINAFDDAITDYSRAIDLRPFQAEPYYNRARAHFYRKDYDRAWSDIHQYQELGGQPNPEFLDALAKASSRPD